MNNISQPKIWDTFLFSGEVQLLCARLRFLDEYCDYFVIVENHFTHSGRSRLVSTVSFRESLSDEFPGKIRWILLEEPNPTFTPWQREAWQRNQINTGLEGIGENDIVMLSDLDEIPNERFIAKVRENSEWNFLVAKMKLFYYEYDLISKHNWFGSIATKWDKPIDFQKLRMKAITSWDLKIFEIVEEAGCHFSSIGSHKNLLTKIQSFSHTEFDLFPFNNKYFLRILILLGISFDGSEVLMYSPIFSEQFHLKCKRRHRLNGLRMTAANCFRPVVAQLFRLQVGRLSSPIDTEV